MTLTTKERTLSALVSFAEKQLKPISDSAKLDAQLLLMHVLNKPMSFCLTWPEFVFSNSQFDSFMALLNRRISNEPIAYILGFKEFWSLDFEVAPTTLIPRPDTEVLVESVLNLLDDSPKSCLDLGTGTGAIAIALATERASWQLEAVDMQPEAVELAQRNLERHKIKNLEIYQSDWFNKVKNKFDIIVSNPPYIDKNDPHLALGDVQFEPKTALISEDNGLFDIKHIIKNAKSYLNNHGYVFFEHGYDQGQSVRELFFDNGFEAAKTVKDYNNNDRITYAQYNYGEKK